MLALKIVESRVGDGRAQCVPARDLPCSGRPEICRGLQNANVLFNMRSTEVEPQIEGKIARLRSVKEHATGKVTRPEGYLLEKAAVLNG